MQDDEARRRGLRQRLAIALWRLPLPRRVQVRLTGILYENPPMEAERAVETLAALQQAGVAVLVMGGWGIDALIGRQRRRHGDLDLIVDRHDIERAAHALRNLGYEEWYRCASKDALGDLEPLGDAIVFRDAALRVTDLHPADVRRAEVTFASGTIGGHSVTCLSPDQQLRAHHGYRKPWRRRERQGREDIRIARQMSSDGLCGDER